MAQSFQVEVTPQAKDDKNIYGETLGTAYVIGIERGFDQEHVNPIVAIGMGAKQTAWWVSTMLVSLGKMFQGKIPAKDIGGPILIVQAAGQQARLGLEYLLHFMAVISVTSASSTSCRSPYWTAGICSSSPSKPSCAGPSTSAIARLRSRSASSC